MKISPKREISKSYQVSLSIANVIAKRPNDYFDAKRPNDYFVRNDQMIILI